MDIRVWIEKEVEVNMDSYENTTEEAVDHIRDMLMEGEYRDELTDEEVKLALAIIGDR